MAFLQLSVRAHMWWSVLSVVFIIIKVYVIQQGYAHLYKIIQKLI